MRPTRGLDDTEITASQAYAGIVASLLLAAAKAKFSGALADQLQVALDSRGLIERAKGVLMERERLDDQEAFIHLHRAARSSGRNCRRWPARLPPGSPVEGADQTDQGPHRAGRRRSGDHAIRRLRRDSFPRLEPTNQECPPDQPAIRGL